MSSLSSHLKSLALCSFAVSLCIVAFPMRTSAQQTVAGVDVFPANNVWNTKVSSLAAHGSSDTWVNSLGRTRNFHPDWGTNPSYGIPFNIVQDGKKLLKFYPVTFDYADESDAGPYPLDKKLLIEGGTWKLKKNGGDRHVLMIHPPTKTLYETFYTNHKGTKFTAGSGAIYHLDSNALRPDGWTSADAAGLPIFPALVNYDEAASGVIKHALRMTCSQTNGKIWPARHSVNTATGWPPLGARFRLKAGFNISSFSPINKAILTAMKEYGLLIADQGSNWYVQGSPDARWDDEDLNALKSLTGNDFEAVDTSGMQVSADSGQSN